MTTRNCHPAKINIMTNKKDGLQTHKLQPCIDQGLSEFSITIRRTDPLISKFPGATIRFFRPLLTPSPSLVLQPPVGRPALQRPVDRPRCSRYPAQQRLNCLNWPNHKFLQIIRSRLEGTLWAAVNLSRACRVPHKISAPPPPVLLNSIIITTYYPHRRRDGSIPSPIPNIRMITSQEL